MNNDFSFASRAGGRIGFIVPSSNTNLEPDCALLIPPGVTTHFTRIGGYDVDAIPDSVAMRTLAKSSLDEPIKLLMDAKPDVIGYACASATFSCGWEFDRHLCDEISAKTGIPAITTSGAIVQALHAININSIGFASPYVKELNLQSIAFFKNAGITVVNSANAGDAITCVDQGNITPQDVFKIACTANHIDAQAIVIGCTDFRAVEAIDALEKQLGKPIITANKAMIDACLDKIGQKAKPIISSPLQGA